MRQKEGDHHCAGRQENNRKSKEVLKGSKEITKESKESVGSQEVPSTAKPGKPTANSTESRELKPEQPTQEEASTKAKPPVKASPAPPPAAPPATAPVVVEKQNLKDLQATQRYDVMGNENVGGYLSAGPDERAFTILMPVVQPEDDGEPKSYFNVLDPLKDKNQTALVEPGGVDVQQGKEGDGSKEIKAAMKA
ncbi:hypothetical protein Y032_0014g2491 [Ancylostoma ceylanicum]|uniref:Uncharacterized protein n=1 Tax=Ancylostoma ceylanicum TaxID=53326 RepID=A0A016VAE4_9BILA|nr:hypothetical protein Y032_0014g2491 [Ancylostoma ceylanicum]